MSGWRDIRRAMRRDVHATMGVPALYLHAPGADPLPINVRGPHNKRPVSTGSKPGDPGWAEREDTQPALILMREDVPADLIFRRNGIFSVELGEAYRVGTVHPWDDNELKIEVTPLTADEAEGLPLPEA